MVTWACMPSEERPLGIRGASRDSSRPLKTVLMAKTALAQILTTWSSVWYGHIGPPQVESFLRASAQISPKDDATRGPIGFRSQRDPARSQDGRDHHRGPNDLAAQLIERGLADAVSPSHTRNRREETL